MLVLAFFCLHVLIGKIRCMSNGNTALEHLRQKTDDKRHIFERI